VGDDDGLTVDEVGATTGELVGISVVALSVGETVVSPSVGWKLGICVKVGGDVDGIKDILG